MKFLFVTGCYPEEFYKELQQASKIPLQNAANTFQWAVINGFLENMIDFSVICAPFVPSYPLRYKKPFIPAGQISCCNMVVGTCVRFTTFVGLKERSRARAIYKSAKQWCVHNRFEDKLVIITYTSLYSVINPIIKLKKTFHNICIVPIITDLIDDAHNFAYNRTLLKRIMLSIEEHREKSIYKYVDKFVLLTRAMEERIPEARNKSIIVEGIYSLQSENNVVNSNDKKERIILYTGSLHKFAGIIELLEAFTQVKNDDYRLMICGAGECEEYVKIKSKEDKRIIYKGNLPRPEVLSLQRQATLLINPRKPDNTITKYSFPSKTMEYLASGTPMIGYKLQGIPEEYYEYYYTVDGLCVKDLASVIEKCMAIPEHLLKEKGANARAFILNNKTAKQQVARIVKFIQ